MAKYTFELKLKIVHDYLDGKGGSDYLAKKYSIKAPSQVKRWINAYQEFGEEGLVRKRQKKKYSVQFKLDAIELYLTSELSYREVANTLNMNNPNLIASWMRQFREGGIDGLSKRKDVHLSCLRKMNPKIRKNLQLKQRLKNVNASRSWRNESVPFKLKMPFKRIEEAAKTGSPTTTNEAIARIIASLRGPFKLVELLETLKFPKAIFMYWQNDWTVKIQIKRLKRKCLKFGRSTRIMAVYG